MSRVDPLANLDDFQPAAKPAKPVVRKHIDQLAAQEGFPSRQATAAAPAPVSPRARRYTTGRNQQINIKATAETVARLNAYADQHQMPLGEVLRVAMDALEVERVK